MKIWALTDGPVKEGKYLVVRRDGTIPEWPHFVLSADDAATPAALRAYARAGAQAGYEPEFIESVYELALQYEKRARTQVSDPDAGPHRRDHPAIIAMMRHEHDLTNYRGVGVGSKYAVCCADGTHLTITANRLDVGNPDWPKFWLGSEIVATFFRPISILMWGE